MVASPSYWKQPLKWNSAAEQDRQCLVCGASSDDEGLHPDGYCSTCEVRTFPIRQRVFCASWADVFEEWTGYMHFPDKKLAEKKVCAWHREGVGIVKAGQTTVDGRGCRPATMQDVREQLFTLIENTPNLTWQLLTKRPQNVMRMVPESWRKQFPDNVQIGTTVEDQPRADERIPELLKIPARVRFLSCEPLLAGVDIAKWLVPDTGLDFVGADDPLARCINWVIVGGESGGQARPMHPQWARSLRDQCKAALVSFFFKQWGEWAPHACPPQRGVYTGAGLFLNVAGRKVSQGDYWDGNAAAIDRVGKAKAGRILDGREWSEFPSRSVL